MRLEHAGRDDVWVAAGRSHVLAVLSDLDELYALVEGLVHADSTPTRWVMGRVAAGPVQLSPAVDVAVTVHEHRIRLVGRPAPRHTPSWLDHTIRLEEAGAGRTLVRTDWRVAVEVPGPQVLAATLRPLLTGGARSIAGQLAVRLEARFAPPGGGDPGDRR